MKVALTVVRHFLRLRQPCVEKILFVKRPFCSNSRALPDLVSCERLKDVLESTGSKEDVVVLDVSWFMNKDAYQEYENEHIPKAFYFNVLDAEHDEYFPRNIPTPEIFKAKASSVGINRNSQVVVYSNTDAGGFFLSSRAWWTFKIFGHRNVSVLDGGFPRWKSLGFPVTSEEPVAKKGNFVPSWHAPMYLTFEEMMKIDLKQAQICDTRAPALYSGPKSRGRIPGAHNLPMINMVDPEKGVLKSKHELKEVFRDAGFDVSKPITMYCEVGMTVATVSFAALQCGCPSAAIYHGGFNEWRQRAPEEKIER